VLPLCLHLPPPFLLLASRLQLRLAFPGSFSRLSLLPFPLHPARDAAGPLGRSEELHVEQFLFAFRDLPLAGLLGLLDDGKDLFDESIPQNLLVGVPCLPDRVDERLVLGQSDGDTLPLVSAKGVFFLCILFLFIEVLFLLFFLVLFSCLGESSPLGSLGGSARPLGVCLRFSGSGGRGGRVGAAVEPVVVQDVVVAIITIVSEFLDTLSSASISYIESHHGRAQLTHCVWSISRCSGIFSLMRSGFQKVQTDS